MKRSLRLCPLPAAAILGLAAWPAKADEGQALAGQCDSVTLGGSDSGPCSSDNGGTVFRIRTSQAMPIGTVESFATLAVQAGNAMSAERLVAGDTRRLGQTSRVMITGIKARLFDDRLTLTTQFGWSNYVDRFAGRPERRDGSALALRLESKLVETTALNWSVAGEMTSVSDNFLTGEAMSEGAQLALPGKRLSLSSTLRWHQSRLTAAYDSYRSNIGVFSSTRLKIHRGGVTLSLKSGGGSFSNPTDPGSAGGRTTTRSATLEFDLTRLFPAVAMDERLPAALLPKHLMVGWRRGSAETGRTAAPERFERNGIELHATWETPFGETGLGFWRDRRVGATVALGRRDERVVQLSHMISQGNWRFGVDATIAQNNSTRGRGLTERNVALGGSIAYEVESGPRLIIQLSSDRARMVSDDLSFANSQRGQQVSAAIDLTDYLRRQFERPDLRLKIDYRKQLDRSTTEVTAYQQLSDRWSEGSRGEGLMVSFGMKL